MTGKEALEAYGYSEQANGFYQRVLAGTVVQTQMWKAVPDGWLCYEPLTRNNGWGVIEGNFLKVPYRTEKSGVRPNDIGNPNIDVDPSAFEWVWPDEVIAFQYGTAAGVYKK